MKSHNAGVSKPIHPRGAQAELLNMSKIVFTGNTLKGNNVLIRYPTKDDARIMCDYINTLSEEKTFITYQGEEINLEYETKYLNDQLEKIKKHTAVQLLVFCEDKLIGISGIDMKDRVSAHVGVFGVSIAKEFRNEGIGKILIQTVLKEAEANLPQLKIVILEVFSSNPIAIEMYKRFGFQQYGLLPEGVQHKGKYVDHIEMYKKI